MSKEKKELQDESTDFLERVFIIRRTALELAVQHAQYDPELVESFDRLHGTEIQLSALHNAGRETIKWAAQKGTAPDTKDEANLKVPDHLLIRRSMHWSINGTISSSSRIRRGRKSESLRRFKAALPARPTGWQCRYGCGNEPRR
jgi:hypothetical protein